MKFNLSLDDMSPHPRAGFGFESIGWCNKLIKKYPDLKINLFVPAAYCRLGEEPCYLSNHKQWLDRLKKLPLDNYRVNVHGMFHRRISKKHGNSNNDEWEHLSLGGARVLAREMAGEFARAGLFKAGYFPNQAHPIFMPTFRPPGWRISREAVQALQSSSGNGIACFAGSKEYYEKVKDVLEVKWVSYNWDLTGPCKVKGDVVAYGHTSDWTNNYMDKERYKLIKNFLDKHANDIEFRFIEEM